MVNPVDLKQKACEDVVKDPNGKRDEYYTQLETERPKLWNLLQSLHSVECHPCYWALQTHDYVVVGFPSKHG